MRSHCLLFALVLPACASTLPTPAPQPGPALWGEAHAETPSSAKLQGEHGYAVAYRSLGAIKVGVTTPDMEPLAMLTLDAGVDASDPQVFPRGEGVLVVWSERGGDGQRETRAVQWVPGSAPKDNEATRAIVAQLPTSDLR